MMMMMMMMMMIMIHQKESKKWSWPNLRHYTFICLEEIRKTTKTPSHDSRHPRWGVTRDIQSTKTATHSAATFCNEDNAIWHASTWRKSVTEQDHNTSVLGPFKEQFTSNCTAIILLSRNIILWDSLYGSHTVVFIIQQTTFIQSNTGLF